MKAYCEKHGWGYEVSKGCTYCDGMAEDNLINSVKLAEIKLKKSSVASGLPPMPRDMSAILRRDTFGHKFVLTISDLKAHMDKHIGKNASIYSRIEFAGTESEWKLAGWYFQPIQNIGPGDFWYHDG